MRAMRLLWINSLKAYSWAHMSISKMECIPLCVLWSHFVGTWGGRDSAEKLRVGERERKARKRAGREKPTHSLLIASTGCTRIAQSGDLFKACTENITHFLQPLY